MSEPCLSSAGGGGLGEEVVFVSITMNKPASCVSRVRWEQAQRRRATTVLWSIVNSVIYLVHNKGVQGGSRNGYEVAGPAVISGQSYHKSDHE